MATPEARIKLSADATGVQKGVAVAQGALGKLQKQMGEIEALSAKSLSFSGLAGIGLSATAAAAALISITKSAADYGDQLDNLSQRTGIAVEDLAKLQYAAKMSDTSTEALTKGVTNLSGLMVAAAGGAKESSALFEKYGISVRNADGSLRSSYDVLGDIADVFSIMPEGVERTTLATDFFGKKLGVELIPLLIQGKAGLKALGDEAERLGLVMSGDQAKAAAEFNDNLDRLAARAKAAGIAIGNEIIPAINAFLQKMLIARDKGLSIGQILFDVLPKQSGDLEQQIAKVNAVIDKIKSQRDAAAKESYDGIFGSVSDGSLEKQVLSQYDAQIKAQEKLLAYLKAQRDKSAIDQAAEDNKRLLLAGSLSAKMVELEKNRAVAAGEASADILKSDKDLMAARIKDAESLRDALRAAYQSSVDEAKKASDEATKLFDKANAKRNSTADKAFDKSVSGLSDEEKAAAYQQQASSMFDNGRYFAAAAGAAQLDGRVKEAEAYAKRAEEFLTRAESFADKTTDPNLTQDIGNSLAALYDTQAKAKQQEANDLQQRAEAQMATLNQVEQKLNELQLKATNFEIKANITDLEVAIANIRKEIEKGAVMPITAGGGSINPNAGASGSFESGGFTGWLGRKDVAGVVHGMEYVTPASVTLQPGVFSFLEALRKHGNKVLPGYEAGGLVSRLSLPSLPSPGSSSSQAARNLTLVLGDSRFGVSAGNDVIDQLENHLAKTALRKGRRR